MVINLSGSVSYWLPGWSRVGLFAAGAVVTAMVVWNEKVVPHFWPGHRLLAGATSVVFQLVGIAVLTITIPINQFASNILAVFGLVGWILLYAGHLWWRSLWMSEKGKALR